MHLPSLQQVRKKTKQYIISFAGLNWTENHKDGEFAAMTNLTSEEYPVLTQRRSRESYRASTGITALFARGHLIFVDGTTLYYTNPATGTVSAVGTVTAGEKQFACVNTRLCIWPDKVYLDLNTLTLKPLALSETREGTFTTSTTDPCTFVTTGAAFTLAAGDGIKITGTTGNNKSAVIRSISADGNTLTFDKSIFTAETAAAAVFSREIPDMDYICEWNNRLWGCGGGKIYASALGLPDNFNVFDGISTDSYAVAVGSDGEFTGIAPYPSHLLVFKEHLTHKVYGTLPRNYELTTGFWPGVKSGSDKSFAIINGVAYFHTSAGVVSYAGSVPTIISANFGTENFSNARAAADGTDYVVSMQDSGGTWGMYGFDTLRGIWTRHDGTHALDMSYYNRHLYYADAAGITMCDSDTAEPGIAWSAEFCRFDEKITQAKQISRFAMRCELEAGSTLSVALAIDGGAFENVKTVTATDRKVYVLPIIPRRCDSFRIKLSGTGRSRVYALTREIGIGSDTE